MALTMKSSIKRKIYFKDLDKYSYLEGAKFWRNVGLSVWSIKETTLTNGKYFLSKNPYFPQKITVLSTHSRNTGFLLFCLDDIPRTSLTRQIIAKSGRSVIL